MDEKEITNNDIMAILLQIQKNATEDRLETKKDLNRIDTKIEQVKKQAEAKEVSDNKRIYNLNNRMSKIELSVDKTKEAIDAIDALKKDHSKLRLQLKEEQAARVRDFKKATGLKDNIDWNKEVEKEEKEKDNTKKKDKDKVLDEKKDNTEVDIIDELMNKTNESYTSDWAKSLSGQLKRDAEKNNTKDNIDKKESITNDKGNIDQTKLKTKKKKPMAALRKWFGDESFESSDSSEDTEDWQKVDRVEANRVKRKKAKKAKNIKEQQTLEKAAHIVGLGPFTNDLRRHHNKEHRDINKATRAAIHDFLSHNLAYDTEDLEELSISEVQEGKDNILYIAFDNMEDIREIRTRIIESGNNDILFRMYIPPQLFDRFRYMNIACSELRQNNSNLKTQIRIGENDFEVYTKVKGSQDPYTKEDLNEIMDMVKAPKFNHSIKWKRKPIQPERKKLHYPNKDSEKQNNTKIRTNSFEVSKNKKAKISHDEEKDDSEDAMMQDNQEENMDSSEPTSL